MKSPISLLAWTAIVCALSLPLAAQDPAPGPAAAKEYAIPGHGSLRLPVPAGWRSGSRSLEKPPSVVMRIGPASGDSFKVLLTAVWLSPQNLATLTPEKLKSNVQEIATRTLQDATEKEAVFVELRGAQTTGYYFSVTQRAEPKSADDYKYMTQGTFRTGEILSIFTLFHRDAVLPEKEQVLRMLAEATHSPTSSSSPPTAAVPPSEILQVRESPQGYEISLPVSRLVMTVPMGGFVRSTNPMGGAADSTRYFYLIDNTNVVTMSGWFEPERRFRGIKEFWESETTSWKRGGAPDPQDVSFTKIGRWDAIVYDVPLPKGISTHIRAHWLEAGTWIDLHVSTVTQGASADARAKLTALVKTIQVKTRE